MEVIAAPTVFDVSSTVVVALGDDRFAKPYFTHAFGLNRGFSAKSNPTEY
jgi:hypothetical protein